MSANERSRQEVSESESESETETERATDAVTIPSTEIAQRHIHMLCSSSVACGQSLGVDHRMDLLFLSRRVYLGDGSHEAPLNGGIVVDTGGVIRRVLRTTQEVNTYLYNTESEAVYDFGDLLLMPGLIDTNVHINEPGRTEWEGFGTATKAAAAGGYTTIINRPTNATPATVNVQTLKARAATARGKIYVDVGFWGGLVPGNKDQLLAQLAAGVVGLQCTLCDSAPPVGAEFAAINEPQLAEALQELDKQQATDTLIAFHAELPPREAAPQQPDEAACKSYESFLQSRPASMELAATELICRAAGQHPQQRFHILNLSCAEALPLLETGRRQAGAQLSAETCPHYLALSAEQVPECGTQFKTWPPIREQANQAALWSALLQPDSPLQLIASDHSAATPGARCLTYGRGRGNFMNAWPGIAGLQLSLPVVWTRAKQSDRPLTLADVHRLMCWQPAQLCGLSRFKGRIAEGYDADFCIWDPDEQFTVSGEELFAAHKSSSPYAGQRLCGTVHATVVRGLHVYQLDEPFGQPLGKVLLRKSTAKLVKFVRL